MCELYLDFDIGSVYLHTSLCSTPCVCKSICDNIKVNMNKHYKIKHYKLVMRQSAFGFRNIQIINRPHQSNKNLVEKYE